MTASVLCIFAITGPAASARNLLRSEKVGGANSITLNDAAGVTSWAGGWVAGFGFPMELVNSGNLKLEATGFKNECTEGDIDTYLNHNSEALNLVEASIVAGQFECENETVLATPSGANAVFAAAALELTVSNLKFIVAVGEKTKCEFRTPPAGIKGTWVNAVGGEEELGSTVKFSKAALIGVALEGTCPTAGELTGTFGAETFQQSEGLGQAPFDTEQVFYG
ncbi:MAG TPA: hypothetical protein VGX26_10270 [Solirubrobacteraceae bacterium]|nr:hypothetical protein [Solirubrobacteraceae bacterium]